MSFLRANVTSLPHDCAGGARPILCRGESKLNIHSLGRTGRFVIYWCPLLAWMVVIFIGSSGGANVQEPEATTGILAPIIRLALERAAESPSPDVWPDIAHLAEFAVLAVLAYWGMRTVEGLSSWALRAAVLAFTVMYAISDEVHQAFVPDRISSVEDILLDAVGGVVGLGIAEAVSWGSRSIMRRREHESARDTR